MRELNFSLVTVRALCSGAWAHTHKASDRHAPLPCMTRNSVGNFNCAGAGDRTGNFRDPSCGKITRDRMENGHGPIRSARTMPKGARNSCSVFIGVS